MVLAAAAVVSLGGWSGRRQNPEAAAHEQRLASMRQEAARWVAATRQQEAEAPRARPRPLSPAPAAAGDVAAHDAVLRTESAALELEPALEEIRVIAPVSADPAHLSQEPRRRVQETL